MRNTVETGKLRFEPLQNVPSELQEELIMKLENEIKEFVANLSHDLGSFSKITLYDLEVELRAEGEEDDDGEDNHDEYEEED